MANGNSNDLCMAKLPFGHSHSNGNTNKGIQNTPNLFLLGKSISGHLHLILSLQ